jgi:photosystem II stability/assembly factor-like uncharacterized protein
MACALAGGRLEFTAAQAPEGLDPSVFREFAWRSVGPLRGGLTLTGTGAPGQPNIFYAGVAGGGIWKTTDYGSTWRPIFDGHSAGSIAALAVAPSNANVVYAGSGGDDGLYKSIDAGSTWTPLGLADAHQISGIAVDPTNASRLLVAVGGPPYGPNAVRGIFRSTDGGQTFAKVLYKDADTGGADVAFDPSNPSTVYGVLRQARLAPWEGGRFSGPGTGIFKSIDAGSTWQPLANGLPDHASDGLDRIALAIAPNSPRRLFALVGARSRAGLYRSDDSGATWTIANADARIAEGTELAVDSRNPDVVYVAGAVVWKSADGGRTFAIWRAAGGAYRRIWMHPGDGNTMLLAGEQGATLTVNGGETWSATSNQDTASVPRVSVQDPADPDVTYSDAVVRYDRRTGQRQNVRPPLDARARIAPNAPLVFSPSEPRALYFGSNVLWKSLNGGQSWTAIGPDQGRDTWEPPASLGVYRGSAAATPVKRGTIVTVSPSALDPNLVWTGTDDGMISVTRDAGRTWTDVTPAELTPWMKVAAIATSHFDGNTAYGVVDASRIDDPRPYIYRTRNGGRTWTPITSGLSHASPIHAVREDRQRRGLLFAGSDRGVHVSFDDGDHWQSLRLNLPATPVREVVIRDDDLVAVTDGRGVWMLDDITALRQVTPDITRTTAYLFRPGSAWRLRPGGVLLSYTLGPAFSGAVTLEILEAATGTVFRRFSSDDPDAPIPATPGLHRVAWDVRFDRPLGAPSGTPGMFLLPGTYQVRLTVPGRVYRQAVIVRTDSRVRASVADLTAQFNLSKSLHDAMRDLADARRTLTSGPGVPAAATAQVPAIAAALERAASPLLGLFLEAQQADARPTATLQAEAHAALQTSEAALSNFRIMIDGAPGQ